MRASLGRDGELLGKMLGPYSKDGNGWRHRRLRGRPGAVVNVGGAVVNVGGATFFNVGGATFFNVGGGDVQSTTVPVRRSTGGEGATVSDGWRRQGSIGGRRRREIWAHAAAGLGARWPRGCELARRLSGGGRAYAHDALDRPRCFGLSRRALD
jgi:hypothetical protein